MSSTKPAATYKTQGRRYVNWGTRTSKPEPVSELEGYKIVSVRMRGAEYVEFTNTVQRLGLTKNRALRVAARKISGFLEVDAETKSILQDLLTQIGLIASEIHDISRAARETGTLDMDDYMEQRRLFAAEFVQLDDALQSLLNVTNRRQDGTRLLQEAAGS